MSSKTTSWLIKLVDKITAPARGIQKAVGSMTAGIDRAMQHVNKLNESQDKFSSMIKGLGVAAAITMLTNQTMAFEHSMQKSNTIMKATPAQFAGVTEAVRDLASDIPIAREQLSEGLYEVLSAGVPKNNALTFLADSAKAAVGGSAELPTLIRTTTTLVKAYNLEFEKSAYIQDKLQKSVDIGSMSMNELAEALPKASVSAAQLGVNIDELLGGFAALSGVTGNANEVGTQLNAVMSALIKPTQEATEMANQLGIAFDATSIKKAGGLAQYLDALLPKIRAFAASSGMNQEEIIARLFGREEAIRGMLAVSGSLADTWKNSTAEIVNATGSVSSAFEIMKTSSLNQMELFKNSMYAMWDNIWAVIGPVVMRIINLIADIFNGIRNFTEQYPGITSIAEAIFYMSLAVWAVYSAISWASAAWALFKSSMLVGAITQIIGLITTLGFAILGLQAPFWAATSSTLALNLALYANPIIWIVGIIAILIAAVVLMIKYWDDVKAWFVGLYNWFLDHNPFQWLWDLIKTLMPMLKEKWNQLWTGLKNAMQPVLDFFNMLKEKWDKLWNAISSAKDALYNFLGIPKNLDFRGYGEVQVVPTGAPDQETLNMISMQRKKNEQERAMLKPNIPTFSQANGQGAGMEASGGTKGAAIVNFKNQFDIVIKEATGDLKQIANEVAAVIADQMSDAAIINR